MKHLDALRRQWLACLILACVVAIAGGWILWSRDIESTVVIEAGPKDGFFDVAARTIQSELKQRDIESTVINREDTLKIIDDVDDNHSPIDVGFMAQDTGGKAYRNVTTVGTIALEPLFIFFSAALDIRSLQDLKGRRIAVSPPGSGTRAVADVLLGLYGVNVQTATFVPLGLNDSADAIREGRVDAALLLQPPGAKVIQALALDPTLRMLSLSQSDALASNLGFVRAVTIHEGGFDYVRNIPSAEMLLVAVPVTVIVKKDLKPAVVTVIAQGLKTHFQNATLVSKAGEVLAIYQPSIAANEHAETVLKSGLPYIYRKLPFSVAALIDHFSLYIGFVIFVASVYSSMRPPSPTVIWREIQLRWYVRKLERRFGQIVDEKRNVEPEDLQLIDKVKGLLNSGQARLAKVSKLVADVESRI